MVGSARCCQTPCSGHLCSHTGQSRVIASNRLRLIVPVPWGLVWVIADHRPTGVHDGHIAIGCSESLARGAVDAAVLALGFPASDTDRLWRNADFCLRHLLAPCG